MSTTKTLSNGTLGLKFMQNALRAKQQKEVTLEKAEVKDDGEWEVSKAVREAWGLTPGSATAETQVHEESYLPFLFSESSTEQSGSRPRGRRVFGKKGEEIVEKAMEETPAESNATTSETKDSDGTGKGRKIHPRPISISTAGSSGFLRGFEHLKQPRAGDSVSATGKSARQMIFESGGVGSDLRGSRQQAGPSGQPVSSSSQKGTPVSSESATTGFMKPAGVDEPSRPSVKNSADKPHEKKSKRKRQGIQSEMDDRSKKQKTVKQNLT